MRYKLTLFHKLVSVVIFKYDFKYDYYLADNYFKSNNISQFVNLKWLYISIHMGVIS